MTYTLIPQTFLSPLEPGLHRMTAQARSCGASGIHFRTVEVLGYVEHGQLAHIETLGGEVLVWWTWSRTREADRAAARRAWVEAQQ